MSFSHGIEWDVSFVQELLDEMPQTDAFAWNSYYSHGLRLLDKTGLKDMFKAYHPPMTVCKRV